jgi:hypothetical protein
MWAGETSGNVINSWDTGAADREVYSIPPNTTGFMFRTNEPVFPA